MLLRSSETRALQGSRILLRDGLGIADNLVSLLGKISSKSAEIPILGRWSCNWRLLSQDTGQGLCMAIEQIF